MDTCFAMDSATNPSVPATANPAARSLKKPTTAAGELRTFSAMTVLPCSRIDAYNLVAAGVVRLLGCARKREHDVDTAPAAEHCHEAAGVNARRNLVKACLD
mmetsp:Transcript_385/g.614  ORF Transcript_385/g.614 Transcript_385/m.614 type:complete len:102 (-) Transcript_385:175-480(-)